MAKSLSLRALLTATPATGASANQSDDWTVGLDGYAEADRREISLAPTADDEEVTLIGDVAGLIIASTNGVPFSVRLEADGRLIGPTLLFVLGFYAADEVVLATADGGVLLTSEGVDTAELLAIQVKTTT